MAKYCCKKLNKTSLCNYSPVEFRLGYTHDIVVGEVAAVVRRIRAGMQ